MLLDRDGVINSDVGSPGVLAPSQVEIVPGAAEAIHVLRGRGCRVSIVTNQNAVGKGRLVLSALHDIHTRLMRELRSAQDHSPKDAAALVDDFFVAVGVEKLAMGEDGGQGERDPAVLGARKFALKPGIALLAVQHGLAVYTHAVGALPKAKSGASSGSVCSQSALQLF